MGYQVVNALYFIAKYFSIICLIVLVVQSSFDALRSALRATNRPELRQGYGKLFAGYIILMGLPFLVLSIGTLTQGVPSLLYPFLLGVGNRFSWALFGIVLVEYVLLLVWVWFLGGADFLVNHPGLSTLGRRFTRSARSAKFHVTIGIIGGVTAMIICGLFSFYLRTLDH